jgi:ATP-dependent Clp protease ATP-binding subunit ClpC
VFETFTPEARQVIVLAEDEARGLGHTQIGTEHLLLGLIAEPDGSAGRLLRTLGAEYRLTRRAVAAALAAFVHLRAQGQAAAPPAAGLAAAVREELKPIMERLERLEARVGTAGTAP